MSKFLESADARETSIELMRAILNVAGDDDDRAAQMWANGVTDGELALIIERVTKNGLHETTDFYWGDMGNQWAYAINDETLFDVVWVAPNPRAPADVIYSRLTASAAEARCDALNRETRGAAGRYVVRVGSNSRTAK